MVGGYNNRLKFRRVRKQRRTRKTRWTTTRGSNVCGTQSETYTYHRTSPGDAELTLRLTRPRSFGRVGAWMVLIVAASTVLLRLRGRGGAFA